jgi:hypothetical protein
MKCELHKNGAKCVCAFTKIRLVIVTSCTWLVPYFVRWPNYTLLTSLWCPTPFFLTFLETLQTWYHPFSYPCINCFLTTYMVDYSDCQIPEVIFDKFKDKWNSLACHQVQVSKLRMLITQFVCIVYFQVFSCEFFVTIKLFTRLVDS